MSEPVCGDCWYPNDDDGFVRLCPLHASASALLEALERVVGIHDCNTDGAYCNPCVLAREEIARARGEK